MVAKEEGVVWYCKVLVRACRCVVVDYCSAGKGTCLVVVVYSRKGVVVWL